MDSSISVIIPVYNRLDTLRDAIESLLMQTFKPLEIIVVNDGSSFDYISHLKNYSAHISIINIKENKGVSYARNRGIEAAKGKYIAFLDSDDIFIRRKLERQISYMTENNLDISHTDEFWFKKGVWINPDKNSSRYGGDIFSKILDKCRISPSSLMVKKDVFENIGMFDENLRVCEDYEISIRMARAYNIGYLKEKLLIKRAVTDNGLSGGIKYIESIRLNILEKFYKEYKDTLTETQAASVAAELAKKRAIVKNKANSS